MNLRSWLQPFTHECCCFPLFARSNHCAPNQSNQLFSQVAISVPRSPKWSKNPLGCAKTLCGTPWETSTCWYSRSTHWLTEQWENHDDYAKNIAPQHNAFHDNWRWHSPCRPSGSNNDQKTSNSYPYLPWYTNQRVDPMESRSTPTTGSNKAPVTTKTDAFLVILYQIDRCSYTHLRDYAVNAIRNPKLMKWLPPKSVTTELDPDRSRLKSGCSLSRLSPLPEAPKLQWTPNHYHRPHY